MTKPPTPEQLVAWRAETEKALAEAREELAGLQRRVKQLEERLQLIDGLMALGEGPAGHEIEDVGDSETFVDKCVHVLRDNGEPMHIGDLHSALLEHGIPIPGKGNQANVIARIQRSDGRIIRTDRGVYGLPEFGVPEKIPVRRRKK